MKPDEYATQLKAINSDAEAKRKALAIEYAMSNNTVKIGDIIEDHAGKILVEKINVGNILSPTPCCVYYGIEIIKAGKPSKRAVKRHVWQTNLK